MTTIGDQIDEIRERWEGMDERVYCKDWLHEVIRHGQRNMSDICNHCLSYGNDSSDSSDDNRDEPPHPDSYDGEIFAYASYDINILLGIIDRLQKELKQTKLEISLMPGGEEYLIAKEHFNDIQK